MRYRTVENQHSGIMLTGWLLLGWKQNQASLAETSAYSLEALNERAELLPKQLTIMLRLSPDVRISYLDASAGGIGHCANQPA